MMGMSCLPAMGRAAPAALRSSARATVINVGRNTVNAQIEMVAELISVGRLAPGERDADPSRNCVWLGVSRDDLRHALATWRPRAGWSPARRERGRHLRRRVQRSGPHTWRAYQSNAPATGMWRAGQGACPPRKARRCPVGSEE